MKNGRSLSSLRSELVRIAGMQEDMIVPSSRIRCVARAGDPLQLVINKPDGLQHYEVTELARRQLAEKLEIPFAYFERMRSEQPQLLESNVNTWLVSEAAKTKRMLRTVGTNVRAVLSDRYRRLDNLDLANAVVPVLEQLPDARFESLELTDTKMFMKVVCPRVSYEIQPGDFVQAGVVISNSEVGCGSVTVQPLIYRLVCKNGLIATDRAFKKMHVGRAHGIEEELVHVFRDETLRKDDEAFFMKVRDVVADAVSQATFLQIGERMQRTLGIAIEAEPEDVITVLGNRHKLTENERKGVLRHFLQEGDMTGYGLVNAVTHYSQEVEDYERATDFEMLGGTLIDLSPTEWKPLAQAIA